ncbi:MAG: type II 3-dehydroquinate dehydratase [Clostridiales bacterium]|nr:type II 3-dehydroquinate dehydratase [Clostridiales bacterium]
MTFKKSLLVINGPNMNLLGTREPEIYGTKTYDQLVSEIQSKAEEMDISIEVFQSNYEGEIIEKIQESNHYYDGIIINGAGYSYTSVAILDALRALSIPVIEVHLSDIEKREEYRRDSLFAEVAQNSIIGEGFDGYFRAMEELNG